MATVVGSSGYSSSRDTRWHTLEKQALNNIAWKLPCRQPTPRESLNSVRVAADSALASSKTFWTGRSLMSSLSGHNCEGQMKSVIVLLEPIVH